MKLDTVGVHIPESQKPESSEYLTFVSDNLMLRVRLFFHTYLFG